VRWLAISSPATIGAYSYERLFAALTAYALERLLYEQFRVWRVEKLTKAQAASVLDALEQDLKEREQHQKNERNGTRGPAVATHGA